MYFRRPASTLAAMAAGLLALDDASTYEVTLFHSFEATGPPTKHTGSQLAQLQVALAANSCVLLRYRAM